MIGLALSGGGFRATLFHVGSLWRLNELGLLKQIDELTSVSGGSIVAAYLGCQWHKLQFDSHGVATNFPAVIVQPITDFCKRTIDVGTILGGLLNPIKHPSQLLINKYGTYLFGDATLQDLPDTGGGPRFTIYATSLQTGASVRFTKAYLGEYHLGKIDNPTFKLALAVAASSAFPPPLCPVRVDVDASAWRRSAISDLNDDAYLKSTMWLADGGVYDNLGLERLVKNCDTIFVSDAGAPFARQRKMIGSRLSMLARTKRTLDIMSEQVRALRMRDLIKRFIDGTKRGAYWGIGTTIGDYPLRRNHLAPALVRDSDTTRAIAKMRTRLNTFRDREQGVLINWGYSLTDAALRSRYDANLAAATTLPIPAFPI